MDYGKILKNAWNIIWTHKIIVWFGFLMMIPNLIIGLITGGLFFFINEETLSLFFDSSAFHPDINPIFLSLFVIAFFVFTILSYVLSALSFAGVLKGTLDLENEETKISFGELRSASFPYVWRIFGVFFLVFGFFSIIIFSGAFLGIITGGVGFLCITPFFLLILPLELIAYLYISLSMTVIIAENLGVFEALKRAWKIMKEHFWHLILLTIILIFIQFALSMLIMMPMQVIQMSFIFSTGFMNATPPDPNSFFHLFAIIMVIFVPLSSLAQGLGLTYANAVWMLTYLELSQTPPENQEADIITEYA